MGSILNFPGTKISAYIFGNGRRQIKASFFFKTRAEYKEFVDFYIQRKGEFSKFWVLNWINEFELTQTVTSGSILLPIKRVGFDERYTGHERIFMIVGEDLIIRKVVDAEIVNNQVENIIVDSGVPYTIYPSSVSMFGRVLLVRFDGQLEMNISRADDSTLYAKTTVTMIELPYEYAEV
ncbi:MAG: hypothetical protein N2712_07830 [Brevinematales bacterium]|nr:hypothetical protein [Brevinematales bacterium]